MGLELISRFLIYSAHSSENNTEGIESGLEKSISNLNPQCMSHLEQQPFDLKEIDYSEL